MLLEHQWEGRSLYMPYIDATLTSIYQITGKSVLLVTKDQNAEEVIFYSDKDHNGEVVQLSRMQYKREFGLTMG